MRSAKAFCGLFALWIFSAICHGYWRLSCGTVQTGRIDPIINPGVISSHVHKIAGASNIGLNSTYNDLVGASCSSCTVQDDKSAYWTPQLYYQHSNGSFEEVPNFDTVVYYLGRGDNRTSIKPFPPGFRMVSGNVSARAYDYNTYTWGGKTGMTYVNGSCDGNGTCTGNGTWVPGYVHGGPQYYGRPVSDRVQWVCLRDTDQVDGIAMNVTNCTNGLRAQIHFQSCWDGVNLYKSDNSHVAYMSQIDNGICPPTHPVQFVHLLYEILYGVNNVNQSNGGQFVLAYGDPTGYGYHGDFLNGWNMTTLTAALAQCAVVDNNGLISKCAPLVPSNEVNAGINCPEQRPLIAEPVHGMLSKLPGCINMTSGPSPAPVSSMVCPAGYPQPSLYPTSTAAAAPVPTFYPSVGKTYNGWKYVGCATDSTGSRTLTGPTTSANNMTTEMCQSFCAGHNLPLAGTEYSSQCYCGVVVAGGAQLGQDCGADGGAMVCAGNRSEMCGGPSRLSLWNSTAYHGPEHMIPQSVGDKLGYNASATAKATAKYSGCAPELSGGRALSGAMWWDSTVTIESCLAFCAGKKMKLAGMEYADECYCGNALAAGSKLGASTACTMPCAGNATEWCGGPSALSVWSVTGT